MDNPFLGRSRIYGWTFDEALRNLPSLLPSFFLAGWIFEDYVGGGGNFFSKENCYFFFFDRSCFLKEFNNNYDDDVTRV